MLVTSLSILWLVRLDVNLSSFESGFIGPSLPKGIPSIPTTVLFFLGNSCAPVIERHRFRQAVCDVMI